MQFTKSLLLKRFLLLALILTLVGCTPKIVATSDQADQVVTEQQVSAEQEMPSEVNMTQTEAESQVSTESQSVSATEGQVTESETEAEVPAKSLPSENPTEVKQIIPIVALEGPVLKISGEVAKTLEMDLEGLKALKSYAVEADYFALNSFGTKAHFTFRGISLWQLLSQEAMISDSATEVTFIATDGYEMTFTVDQVKKQDYMDETDLSKKLQMIIAWEENGAAYDPEEGPPFKLVVGQVGPGDVNKPQWVSNIDRIIVK